MFLMKIFAMRIWSQCASNGFCFLGCMKARMLSRAKGLEGGMWNHEVAWPKKKKVQKTGRANKWHTICPCAPMCACTCTHMNIHMGLQEDKWNIKGEFSMCYPQYNMLIFTSEPSDEHRNCNWRWLVLIKSWALCFHTLTSILWLGWTNKIPCGLVLEREVVHLSSNWSTWQ